MINPNIPLDLIIDKTLSQSEQIKGKFANTKVIEKSFSEELKTATKEQLKIYFEELLNQIELQGKILIQSPIYENFIKYRNLVQTFMEKVVKNLYLIEENVTTVRSPYTQIGQRKVYVIIKEINNNLAELTEEVLKSQANPINIAARVEMIQGLLMDLYS